MGKDISDAVREICLGLPEAREVRSHGSPDFRVGGHTFATYVINHHGDGRVALWLNMPPGAQRLYVEAEPEACFVPPYVGPRGWLGVKLDKGRTSFGSALAERAHALAERAHAFDWGRIGALVREAYAHVAPPELVARMGKPSDIEPPTETVPPEVFDPLSPPRIRELIDGLRQRCMALPEAEETTTFGNPAWRAGRKTFATAHRYGGRLELQFWVGAERQAALTMDERYRIPPYNGHNGWIALDAEDGVMWNEVEALMLESYRHFALKRMHKALDAVGAA